MKPYQTLASVRLFSGMIGLTDDQLKWRMNCLSKIKDDIYEIKKEVVFKAGEVIGLEDPPKPYRKHLKCLEPDLSVAVQDDIPFAAEVKAEAEPTVIKKRGRKPKVKV